MFHEDGVTRETLTATINQALESTESEYRHGWTGMMQHKDVEATVTMETPDDVDVESTKQLRERGIVLTPMKMKALIESGEYELRPSSR